jgi:hypothetical protein
MMKVKAYRKKPVTIHAMQWTGDNFNEIKEFVGESLEAFHFKGTIGIQTLEGTMSANEGYYIIKGVRGEFYPCKPDIFEETYYEVEDD